MAGKNGRSFTNAVVMCIIIICSLALITYPFAFTVSGQTEDSVLGSSTNSNNTDLDDPLAVAVLTLDDGTIAGGATSSGSDSDSVTDSSNELASSGSDSTSDPSTDSSSRTTLLDLDDAAGTIEVGSATDEVGSATDEVRSATDEVGSETGTVTEVPTGESETTGNASDSNQETGSADSANPSEPPAELIPSDSTEASIGTGSQITDQSSATPSDTNAAVNVNSGLSDITAASAENPNAVVQPILADGTPQEVSLGDVSNNKPAKLSLDKKFYNPGDTAVLTISDQAANVDPYFANTVQVIIGGTVMTATEDEPDSGIFTVPFVVSAGGSKMKYDASHPQALAVINGVSKGGEIEVEEVSVSSLPPELAQGRPTQLVGNAIQFTLLGEAELDRSSGFCQSLELPPPCGGSSTVTLSYANAPLHNQPESKLTVFQFIPGLNGPSGEWVDLQAALGVMCNCDAVKVDPATKTVTVIDSPLGLLGVVVLGFPAGGGSGGGSGGAAFPGAGLVLDLVAPIIAQPVSESTTSLPDTPALNVEDDDTTSSSAVGSDSNANVSATVESVKSGVGTGEASDISAISSSGNTTIVVPGEGNVTLRFTNIISEGALTVSPVKGSDLAEFKVTMNGGRPATVMSMDDTPYSLAGTVFVVGPTDTEFKGTVTVSIPYKASLLSPGSDVKLLHYTGSGWEDVTTQADLNVVSGSLSTLGAVVPAVKSQSISLVSATQ